MSAIKTAQFSQGIIRKKKNINLPTACVIKQFPRYEVYAVIDRLKEGTPKEPF